LRRFRFRLRAEAAFGNHVTGAELALQQVTRGLPSGAGTVSSSVG
jgi:hypothetical protein